MNIKVAAFTVSEKSSNTGVGNIANMSLNIIRENKTLAKISEYTIFNILGHKLALLYNLRVYIENTR